MNVSFSKTKKKVDQISRYSMPNQKFRKRILRIENIALYTRRKKKTFLRKYYLRFQRLHNFRNILCVMP